MSIKQISVFLENKPGTLKKLTSVMAKNKIDMRATSLAETKDFGIARIITDDCAKAEEILKANDYIVKTTGVIAIEIPDEAGSLNKIVKLLAENGADPDVKDMMGMSAYTYAVLFKKQRLVEILQPYHKYIQHHLA